jgi:hypothetical protein
MSSCKYVKGKGSVTVLTIPLGAVLTCRAPEAVYRFQESFLPDGMLIDLDIN